ncbi:MAG: trypsin-like peptidase domain-containing protein [Lachnospiraceae bacterium]|nr:trypsin-like peptidase domain-containing protein [Lachnospiraceae bacterium]
MTENNINMTEIINEEAEVLRVEAVQAVPEAVPAQTVKKVSKTKGHGGRIVALVLAGSLLGGVIGAGSMAAYDGLFRKDNTSVTAEKESPAGILRGKKEETTLNVSYVKTGKEMSAADIYEANVNSTVGITTSVTTNYFGFRTTAAASGSGFILTSDGYIATNYHVIEDASDIKVTLYDDTAYKAELVGYDESNDLAVLKIDANNLQPVILGSSDQLRVGDSVIAIGNPLGELTFSLTHGAVSALNRTITVNNNSMTLIQTDCAINSGNSGGALFNTYGEVVGIVNAKYSSSGSSSTASIDNIGFAIPIDSVVDILKSIIEKGYVEKPYIGVSVYNLDSGYEAFGLAGAVVSSVEEGSPADKAGIQANDIITKVNGTDIKSVDELKSMIAKGTEGDQFTLTIYRQGKSMEVTVTIAVRRQSVSTEQKTLQEDSNPFGQGGSQGQTNPFGQGGSQGQTNPFGQGGSQGQTNPFGQGGQSEMPSMEDWFRN